MTALSSSHSASAGSGKSTRQEAQEKAAPFVEKLARFGYLAKGVTYMLIGVLAAKAAFVGGGEIGGSKNALATLAGDGIFSTILLWAIGIGLASYALWNLFRAALDPEHEGNNAKALTKRFFFGISGVIHAALAFYVFSTLLMGSGSSESSGGSGSTRTMIINSVLDWGVIGQILIAGIGVGIFVFSVIQAKKAIKSDLSDQLDLSSLDSGKTSVVRKIARTGLAARAVVFALIAWFFVQAAWYGSGAEAGGVEKAMKFFSGVDWLVLGTVAIGLACYGFYMLVKSRYRRIDAS